MISNKLLLATKIDYKNIIRVGHDGVERIREGIFGGDLERSETSGKRDCHRVSNRNLHTCNDEAFKISTGLLGRRTHVGGDEECQF